MKTTLPPRSLIVQPRLTRVTEEILATAKDKIAMIILFGSYAKGTWVQDWYTEGHILYSYQSDFDIMVIVKPKYGGGAARFRIEDNIKRRLEKKGLRGLGLKEPLVTIILESINDVNEHLEQGQYFFTDIKKEGVLLYDRGEFKLSEAKELPPEARKKIAQKDYNHWFEKGSEFCIYSHDALQRNHLNKAAFFLHQATESFYSTILLVFTGYKPKLHDILQLSQMARSYNHELFKIFPCETDEQKKCFELLAKAYIDARYNYEYRITKEQLVYLIERVEKLQKVTEKICLEYINREIA